VFQRPSVPGPSGIAVATLIEETLRRPLFASTEALGKLDDLLPKPPTTGVLVIPAVPD